MVMYYLINQHHIHFLNGIPEPRIEAYLQRQLRRNQEHLVVQRFEQHLLGLIASFLFGTAYASSYLLAIREQRTLVGIQGSRQMLPCVFEHTVYHLHPLYQRQRHR